MIKEWKKFESTVYKLQKFFSPNSRILQNDKIMGKSGTLRQIDISIRDKIGQHDLLIAIECKDHKTPIDIKEIESIIGLFQDIGANKGVIVSAKGFTKSAINKGKEAGLDLYRLIDTNTPKWSAKVTIPVLCILHKLECFNIEIRTIAASNVALPANDNDIYNLPVYDNNKYLGLIKDLILSKWEKGLLPKKEGTYYDIEFVQNPIKIKCCDKIFSANLKCNLSVTEKIYFRNMPISTIALKDEKVGGSSLPLHEFQTEKISLEILDKTWGRLQSENQLAITPAIQMELLC